jgi:hypothetical protein
MNVKYSILAFSYEGLFFSNQGRLLFNFSFERNCKVSFEMEDMEEIWKFGNLRIWGSGNLAIRDFKAAEL